jgi:hypothetical protein
MVTLASGNWNDDRLAEHVGRVRRLWTLIAGIQWPHAMLGSERARSGSAARRHPRGMLDGG